VLGVGAATTLAAWNDAEQSTATFTAGRFGIVGSTDGSAFTEHPEPDLPAALSFQAPPTAMAPGTTTYALLSVRTVEASVAGTAHLLAAQSNSSPATLGHHLRYGVRTLPAGTSCSETTYGTAGAGADVVPSGSLLTTSGTVAQPLPAGGAGAVHYCFAVTLPADAPEAAQGLAQTARWEVVGTSS
jgi:predicted ribosomally synthesized peptide with SipW-like signal peptide